MKHLINLECRFLHVEPWIQRCKDHLKSYSQTKSSYSHRDLHLIPTPFSYPRSQQERNQPTDSKHVEWEGRRRVPTCVAGLPTRHTRKFLLLPPASRPPFPPRDISAFDVSFLWHLCPCTGLQRPLGWGLSS